MTNYFDQLNRETYCHNNNITYHKPKTVIPQQKMTADELRMKWYRQNMGYSY